VTELGSGNQNHTKERGLVEFVGNKIYKNNHSVEYEDLCSGRGIAHVYEWLTGDVVETSSIIQKAKENDEKALECLSYVYRFLIRDAQTLCVMSQAKAVYLSGDNQVTNLEFVTQLKDVLHTEFLNHPKREWLESVDVWTQTESANFNIFGALFLAKKYSH